MIFKNFSRTRIETHIERAALHTGGVMQSPYGLWGIALISFVESALVLPIITDPFLVVYILANRTKTVQGIVVTTTASVVGGVVAYVMAVAFFEFIASYYLTGSNETLFYEIASDFRDNTLILTLLGALTPIPYTLVALVVGFVKGSLLVFIVGSVLGRGFRYAVVGYFTYRFGEGALRFARQRIALFTGVGIIVVAIYIAAHFL